MMSKNYFDHFAKQDLSLKFCLKQLRDLVYSADKKNHDNEIEIFGI